MKNWIILILTILFTASSCEKEIADLTLDDLQDKTEYNKGISISVSDYRDNPVTNIHLNGERFTESDVLSITEAGYYTIEFTYIEGSKTYNELVRFVILDEERGAAEWGLKKWTPATPVFQKNTPYISLIHPAFSPSGVSVPVVVLTSDSVIYQPVNLKADLNGIAFNVKNGVGSTMFTPSKQAPAILSVAGKTYEIDLTRQTAGTIEIAGTISGDTIFAENSVIHISDDLSISPSASITIRQGCFLMIDPGVNIINSGQIMIEGTRDRPVTITCSEENSSWGGFISTGEDNSIHATYSIVCRSGYHEGDPYDYGHAKRQATFYIEQGNLVLDWCFFTDHVGQVFYPVNSEVEVNHCLVQRAKTGGQINKGNISISHSVFTDFPNDQSTYRDEDNDGLYLMGCNATIDFSVFAYCKDDGLDSGGSEGGNITVSNSRFESAFHEGAALSSGGSAVKTHSFINCTFTNCGQGLELGYSSPNHNVIADSCTFTGNNIGIRYGDNYVNQHEGNIIVQNSYSIQNEDKDIWNMIRNNWEADTAKMKFINVYVSDLHPLYPELNIYE